MRRVNECWVSVFEARVKDFEKILKVLPNTLWSPEYLVLGAADRIKELEARLATAEELIVEELEEEYQRRIKALGYDDD